MTNILHFLHHRHELTNFSGSFRNEKISDADTRSDPTFPQIHNEPETPSESDPPYEKFKTKKSKKICQKQGKIIPVSGIRPVVMGVLVAFMRKTTQLSQFQLSSAHSSSTQPIQARQISAQSSQTQPSSGFPSAHSSTASRMASSA